MTDVTQGLLLIVAALVSLLTMYNAARLQSGVLAMSTYAFGGGMLFLTAAFFLLTVPFGVSWESVNAAYKILGLVGFILLGWGSYQIYKMSGIK